MSISTMPAPSRKSLGPGTATISVNFTNNATVTNLNGILSFNSGGNLDGHLWHCGGSDSIDFAGGSFTLGVPPVISGLGGL